jgi:hypothetical protein
MMWTSVDQPPQKVSSLPYLPDYVGTEPESLLRTLRLE